MKKKKLFVVDTDKNFQTQVKSLCPPDQVEVQSYSSGMEIFSLIGKEKPYLVLVNLEVPDINDFVMYDLLKKTNDNSIPVVVTYLNQSEKELQPYKKLKFQAKGYYKKPISNDDLYGILENYLELQEEEEDDDNEFSDANIDRLVRGELVETGLKDEFNASELLEVPDEEPDIKADTKELEADEQKKKTSRMEIELKNQIISLERQNEFLRSENKELSIAIESIKAEMEKQDSQFQQLKSQLQEKTAEHEAYSDLTQKLQTVEKENSSLKLQINHHLTVLENLNKEMDEVRNGVNFYKNRLQELGELLHNALTLTQTENQS
ncbi:MAG: response regulator [Candidatus Aminicenantes bacterium]|nr:MAG: response regulator [Candidatus Aminicenantes bacterium]